MLILQLIIYLFIYFPFGIKTNNQFYTPLHSRREGCHILILLFLHPDDKCLIPEQVDEIISAEILDRDADPDGYTAVKEYMIHGPCSSFNKDAPCMLKDNCSKRYPKNCTIKLQ